MKPLLKARRAVRFDGSTCDAESRALEEQVRFLLRRGWDCGFRQHLYQLIAMGEKAFPTYEAIVSDPQAMSGDVCQVLFVLYHVEGDRRRFLKHAVSGLTGDFGMRSCVTGLLREIGSAAEAPLVVPLLADKEWNVVHNAARTLAAIGGPKELKAMDEWLRGDSRRNDNDTHLRQEVQKYRDELKQRLEDNKDPKKRAKNRQQGWKDLTSTESNEVHRAVRTLSMFGAESVAFLKECLHPVPAVAQKDLDQLLADLDNDSFERREAATRELSRGVVSEAILEKELRNRPSPEQKRRLKAILEGFPKWREKNPELLRGIRAIWVLQQIGTPEARALLEKLAAGAPSAAQTQKAKDALRSLDRLNKR